MKIILPKSYVSEGIIADNLFFAAGPTKGIGDDWHFEGAKIYQRLMGERDFFLAIPQLYEDSHPLCRHRIGQEKSALFPRQLEWETKYLKLAAGINAVGTHPVRGCIMFWLPRESMARPRRDGNPYAMDTRRELGVVTGWLCFNPKLRVVVGAEKGFPGLSVIERGLKAEVGDRFQVHDTLEATVAASIEMAKT